MGHRSRTADGQTNNCVSTVRVSTTSGSQEAALVRRTPAARGCVVPGRAYTPPVLLSSSVARYPSPLATHSVTTSGERSLSPAGGSTTPHDQHVLLNTPSLRNTATGVEAAVVTRAKALILRYTLFVDPLPGISKKKVCLRRITSAPGRPAFARLGPYAWCVCILHSLPSGAHCVATPLIFALF